MKQLGFGLVQVLCGYVFFLSGFGLKSERADIAEVRRVPPRIIKTVDVLEDGSGCLPLCRPSLSPEEFGFQALEEGFDGGIIKAVSLAGHGRGHFIILKFLLKIVRAILATAIRVENAARNLVGLNCPGFTGERLATKACGK